MRIRGIGYIGKLILKRSDKMRVQDCWKMLCVNFAFILAFMVGVTNAFGEKAWVPEITQELIYGYGYNSYVDVADINNDGWNDIVVSTEDSVHLGVYMFLNTTITGSEFATNYAGRSACLGTNNVARGVAIADYDRDGDLDVGYCAQDRFYLYYQPTGGYSTNGVLSTDYSRQPGAQGFFIIPSNFSGTNGLLYLSSYSTTPWRSGESRKFLNVGNAYPDTLRVEGGPAGYVISVDINGDGIDDLVGTANYNNGSGTVYQVGVHLVTNINVNVGDTPSALLDKGTSGESVEMVAAGNLNGSGETDLAVWEYDTSTDNAKVHLYFQPSGGFTNNQSSDETITGLYGGATTKSGRGGSTIAIADLNADGLDDIVVADQFYSKNKLYVFFQKTGVDRFADIVGDADYTITTAWKRTANIKIADINNDGNLDIVYASNLDSASEGVGIIFAEPPPKGTVILIK